MFSGLFQRALMSSGSAVAPWIVDNDTIDVSKQIIRIVKCESNTMICLRSKSVPELLEAFQSYSKVTFCTECQINQISNKLWFKFQSVNRTDILLPIQDAFLPADDRYLPVAAIDSFRDGIYLKIPTLIGVGSVVKYPEIGKIDKQYHELSTRLLFLADEWVNLLSQGYFFLQRFVKKVKIPELLQLYKLNKKMWELVTRLIEWQYSLFIDLDGRFLIEQLRKLEYEAKVEAPVFQQVFYMSQNIDSPTYVYSMQDTEFLLDISGVYLPFFKLQFDLFIRPDFLDNSATLDQILFFGPNTMRHINRRRFKTKETVLSNKIQEYFANFISFG